MLFYKSFIYSFYFFFLTGQGFEKIAGTILRGHFARQNEQEEKRPNCKGEKVGKGYQIQFFSIKKKLVELEMI